MPFISEDKFTNRILKQIASGDESVFLGVPEELDVEEVGRVDFEVFDDAGVKIDVLKDEDWPSWLEVILEQEVLGARNLLRFEFDMSDDDPLYWLPVLRVDDKRLLELIISHSELIEGNLSYLVDLNQGRPIYDRVLKGQVLDRGQLDFGVVRELDKVSQLDAEVWQGDVLEGDLMDDWLDLE